MNLSQQVPEPGGGQLNRPNLWVALVLVLLTVLVYSQVGSFKFVYDDSLYITQNSRTLAGLNRDSLRWAFTCFEDGSFLPLVWLSHAACVTMFGSAPAGHHFVNLALHLANTLLLFLLLRRVTGDLGPSAVVAILFALHPTHVESVAWVSGRKDVLSTLFWFLTLWAYAGYARNPSWKRYLAVVALFALGLLSKSMLVTLPLTLMLLDLWPLGRMGSLAAPLPDLIRRARSLLLEKIPLLSLSLFAGLGTIWAQDQIGAISASGALSLSVRAANAALAILKYVQLLFWPAGLSPFYSHPGKLYSRPLLVLACLLVAGATVMCLIQIRKRPYLCVGWLWFLVTLLPVAGFVQVGAQAYADRYTYVPLTGLFIMLAWTGSELLTRISVPRVLLLALSGSLLGALMTLTAVQISRWQDTETLFAHAISLDPNNEIALANLGTALGQEGRYVEAIGAMSRAVAVNPRYYLFQYNLGNLLERVGQPQAALASFREAARLEPQSVLADYRLGHLLVQQGDLQSARSHIEKVFAANPRMITPDPGVRKVVLQVCLVDLGIILREGRRLPEAIQKIEEALAMNSNYGWAHLQLGITLRESGREKEAEEHVRTAFLLEPSSATFRYHLGTACIKAGRLEEAEDLFRAIFATNPESHLARKGMEDLQKARGGTRTPAPGKRQIKGR